MLSLYACLQDIAHVSGHPIAWLAPHRPVITIISAMLSPVDIISLHGAFEGFVGGKPMMSKQYWSMSFDPAVRNVQEVMLRYGRVDILRALYYAGWAAKILDPERVRDAVMMKNHNAVEFYAEMFCVRMSPHVRDDLKCFENIDAMMTNGKNMRALMMHMPKQLLEQIAVKFLGTKDSWLHLDILDIVDTADYHLLHTFGCNVNHVDCMDRVDTPAHEHKIEHGDSTLYQHKELTKFEKEQQRNNRLFVTYSWVPEFAKRVKELAAAGQINCAQTYVQHDDDIVSQYRIQNLF